MNQSEREAEYPFGTDRYVRGPTARPYYPRKDRTLSIDPKLEVPTDFNCLCDADPRIELVIREASKYLPNGWQAVTGCMQADTPGYKAPDGNPGEKTGGILLRRLSENATSNHGTGKAIDVFLITNKGVALGNIRNTRTFRAYELWAQCVGKCIVSNIVFDDDGNKVDWSDLRFIDGGRPRNKLGHRRVFEMGPGGEYGDEIPSRNPEGVILPAGYIGKGPPDGAMNTGIRWGGYFGGSNAQTYREDLGEVPVLEKIDVKKGVSIIAWNLDGNREFSGIKKYTFTLEDGTTLTPDLATNVICDSMHFDFTPSSDPGWRSGLSDWAKKKLTDPAGNEPVSVPIRNWADFDLPYDQENSKTRFEFGLGIPVPEGYVAIRPPAAPAVVINSCVAPKPKVEVDATTVMSSDYGPDTTEYMPIPITQPGTVAIPAKVSRTQAAWDATVNTANTVINYITK